MRVLRSVVALFVIVGIAFPLEAFADRRGFGEPPPAKIDDVVWLAGRWVGKTPGADSREIELTILPPDSGSMSAYARVSGPKALEFLKIFQFREEDGSLVLCRSVVYAGMPDDSKPASCAPLLFHNERGLGFMFAMTIERIGADEIRISEPYIDGSNGAIREETIVYRRQAASPAEQ